MLRCALSGDHGNPIFVVQPYCRYCTSKLRRTSWVVLMYSDHTLTFSSHWWCLSFFMEWTREQNIYRSYFIFWCRWSVCSHVSSIWSVLKLTALSRQLPLELSESDFIGHRHWLFPVIHTCQLKIMNSCFRNGEVSLVIFWHKLKC